eukprot:1632591-Alexandrium_andersonii.AAC.1
MAQRRLVQLAADSRSCRDAVCDCGRLLAGDARSGLVCVCGRCPRPGSRWESPQRGRSAAACGPRGRL